MSGHSKWATIKHGKAITDAKRGKAFSRISKEISIAVREGGSDNPDFNPRLRLAIEKSRSENMPKENIKRAIDKGAGRVAGAMYEEITYEGFGPNKVALVITCVTDNKNRTNAEIRSLLDKNGGVLGSTGSTSYFFDRKGAITVSLSGKNKEEVQLSLIDFGVEDFQDLEEDEIIAITAANSVHDIGQKIKDSGFEVGDIEVIMVSNTKIELNESQYEKFLNFYDILDDHEDVQRIFHNAKTI